MPLELKSASRIALDLRLPDVAELSPVVCGIAYGAGRVAYSALETTWRWGMSKEHLLAHQAFWKSLVLWLSEMGKPRVRLLSDSSGAVVGEEYRLDLAATGDDFLPSPNAVVTASVVAPDGGEHLVALNPLWEEEGRYNAFFVPYIPGEYKVNYEIRLPERMLHAQTAFVARQIGVEADDVSYNEALLRDMARIAGGRFFTVEEYGKLSALPVSSELPKRTETMPLSSYWPLYALFAMCVEDFAFWVVEIPLLNQSMTSHHDELLELGVVPVLAFGDARLADVDGDLTGIQGMHQLGEAATGIHIHLQWEGRLLIRQIREVRGV